MKVKFKTRSQIPPVGKVVAPGEIDEIPDEFFNEELHEKVAEDEPSGEPSPTPDDRR